MTLRFLSAADVRKALPMAEAIQVMKQAFIRVSHGEAVMPARTHLEVPRHQGNALVMPSYLAADDALGVKVVTLFDRNPRRGLPRVQALMLLFDGADGRPLAVIDGTSLTALRTGAASGAATDLLARPGARTAAIFGAGVQGRTQLEAVCAVRPIRQAWVFDPDAQAAAAFARQMGETLSLPVERAGTPAEAVREADVVCTATTARAPVFADGDLKPGVHVNAVGSYQPDVQEVPAETVLRARIVVDHRPSALTEAGDLMAPIEQGLLGKDAIHAELGEIAAGEKPGRTSEDQVTLFKSVGIAVQDLLAAARVLESAKRANLGVEIAF